MHVLVIVPDWELRGRFGTMGMMGRRSPGCFFLVLSRSIPKPDQHRKDIIQRNSLGTDML